MRTVLQIFFGISLIFFNACDFKQEQSNPFLNEPNQTSNAEYESNSTTFLNIYGDESLFITMAENKPSTIFHLIYNDVVLEVENCDDNQFIICVLKPFPLFLPKQSSPIEFQTKYDNKFRIALAFPKGEAVYSNTCENYGFWLVVEDVTTSKTYWYGFRKPDGLVSIFSTDPSEYKIPIPTLNFRRDQGHIFQFADICE